jgi:hypothetical protein
MAKRRLIWVAVALAVALLIPAMPALADDGPPGDGGLTVWNKDYTVEAGETIEGDLVVINGSVTVESGGTVEGSLIVWNGNANVDGDVRGNLVVTNGDIQLEDDARIEGNVICSANCTLEQGEGATIDGSIVEGIPIPPIPRIRLEDGTPIVMPSPINVMLSSGPEWILSQALSLAQSVISAVVVAVVAGLVALMLPQHTESTGQAVVKAPWASFGYGLLTAFVAAVAIIVLTITICLSPIAMLGAFVLGAAGLFGWISLGTLIGARLLDTLNARWAAPVWAGGLGTLILTLVTAGLSSLPCVGVLGVFLTLILGCLGLGAVVVTRFGTMKYPPSYPAPPKPASAHVETPESSELVEGEPTSD